MFTHTPFLSSIHATAKFESSDFFISSYSLFYLQLIRFYKTQGSGSSNDVSFRGQDFYVN